MFIIHFTRCDSICFIVCTIGESSSCASEETVEEGEDINYACQMSFSEYNGALLDDYQDGLESSRPYISLNDSTGEVCAHENTAHTAGEDGLAR